MKTRIFLTFMLTLVLASFVSAECTDSDNGKDYYNKGHIEGLYFQNQQQSSVDDVCTLSGSLTGSCNGETCKLVEYYCDSSSNESLGSFVNLEQYQCPDGCVNGACAQSNQTITCHDSDGDLNYYTKGIVSYNDPTAPYRSTNVSDTCTNDWGYNLVEYDCGFTNAYQRQDVVGHYYKCPNGCSNGACIMPPTPVENCGELIYFCSLDSPYCNLTEPAINQYIESDTCVHVTKNMIDSFMNLPKNEVALKYNIDHVPAFVFIDKNGCFGEIGRAGNTKLADIKNGVANFKCGINSSLPSTPECPTYTCEGGFKPDCEIVNNQCSCETCPSIPIEPNSTTGPMEIPIVNSTTTNYLCSGCPLDNKCYPFGYRKEGNFCSDSGKFEEQLNSNKICENNFECSSNVCISGKCISESFIQKILDWFSRLFSTN